jgi:hypothetical protein
MMEVIRMMTGRSEVAFERESSFVCFLAKDHKRTIKGGRFRTEGGVKRRRWMELNERVQRRKEKLDNEIESTNNLLTSF